MWSLLKIAFTDRRVKILALVGLAIECVSIYGVFTLNGIYGDLYGAIQAYNVPGIWSSISWFTGIAMGLVVVNGFLTFYLNRLAFAVRTAITEYYLPLGIPGFNQQIQEDIRQFSDVGVEFAGAVFRATIKLPLFAGLVITLTEWWVGVTIVVLAVLGTLATKLLSQKQIRLQSVQEQNEATFRVSLSEHAFGVIKSQFELINKEIKKLAFLQSGLGQMFVLLPFILLLPLYISKSINLGVLMQSSRALGTVIDSLTILIDSRGLIVKLETALTRLKGLQDAARK